MAIGKKKTVLVAVTNDISTDQRVHKISNYLLEKGFDVQVYGRLHSNTIEVKRKYKIFRKKHYFNNNFLFYAEFNLRLLWFLIFNKFDYILSNDLDTLLACSLGSKIKKSKLIYDSHEYFTEVPELQDRYFVRGFWLFLERLLLPKVKYAFTVSESIANEYKMKYDVDMEVVRNVPTLKKEFIYENVYFPTNNKVILYQGVLNPGRGIKPVIKSLKYLKDVDLVIIGYGKVKEELILFVKNENLEERVHFLGRIAFEKLHNYGKIASVGMVLEEPFGKSFEFSLPNKLFDFIHLELPIIASPLKEVKKIVNKCEVGIVVDNFEPDHIAEKVSELLNDKDLMTRIRLNQKKVKMQFCWENEVKVLDKYFKEKVIS